MTSDANTTPGISNATSDLYSAASNWAGQMRKCGKRIVFTNGCFDILHVGHIRLLSKARALGDVLIVGLNSDDSVKRLKGPERPFVGENERAEMLQALKSVDYTCVYGEDTPYDLIHAVQPDFLVKGGDWPIDQIVGADIVIARGGQVLSLDFVDGRSTTSLVERVRNTGN